jgi:tetratricopeptide (TPR) repeat protein
MMLTNLLLSLSLAAAAAPADQLADAKAALEQGRPAAAAEILSGMLKAKEGDEHAVRLLLADAQLASGRPDAALDTLEPVATGTDAAALHKMGDAFKANGDRLAADKRKSADAQFMYEQAADYLGRACDAGDTSAGVQAGMMELYQFSDPDTARSLAEKVLTKAPKDGEGLLLRGCVATIECWNAGQAGENDKAAKLRDSAIADLLAADTALEGKRPEPQFQLAFLYEQAGQPDKAVDAAAAWSDRLPKPDFSKLYELAKRLRTELQFEPSSHALVLMVQRDASKLTALVAAEQDPTAVALSLSGSLGPLFNQVQGGAGVGGGNAAKGKDILAALCAVDPKNADIWNNYGLVCRDLQAFEESLRAYEKALVLTPDDPQVLNDTAVILHYYLHRDYERAQDLYEKSIEASTKMLETPDKLSPELKDATERVKKDATNNLANLAKGVHDWKG